VNLKVDMNIVMYTADFSSALLRKIPGMVLLRGLYPLFTLIILNAKTIGQFQYM